MSDIDSLEQAIQTKLQTDNERIQHEQAAFQDHMADLARRHEMFNQTAAKLIHAIVQPRVEALARHFDNARLGETELPQHFCCKCRFNHSSRFPASVSVTFGVTHDDEIRNALLYYDLEILPIFFKFSPHEQTILP